MQISYEKCQQKLELVWQSKRLETFKKWPFDDDKPCSAFKLAEAGFYFTGNDKYPDAVECFLCDKALDGWDEQDDPWAEHISHSKNCEFAQLKQPEEALTFQQINNFKKQLLIKTLEKGLKEIQTDVDDLYNARLHKIKKIIRSLKSKMVV